MLQKEIEFISLYKTNEKIFGYNNSTGGESSRKGCKVSQETKNKISEYQKNRKRKPLSQETKDKISAGNKNKKLSEQQKELVSRRFKGQTPWNKGIKQKDYVKK
jgi:hypothetical protein